MPKQNACCAFYAGKMTFFANCSLLAEYLEIDSESVRRWRVRLVKEEKPLIWSYQGILIDFNPTIYNNKSEEQIT